MIKDIISVENIIVRMDELGLVARERMNASADYPGKVYAEIMHMTQEEAEEMLQLRLMLPSPGQERVAAVLRIKEKISKRKEKLVVDLG